MLAVRKVGAAYVPLDADYPEKRIYYILASCGAKALIAVSALATRYPLDSVPVEVNSDGDVL